MTDWYNATLIFITTNKAYYEPRLCYVTDHLIICSALPPVLELCVTKQNPCMLQPVAVEYLKSLNFFPYGVKHKHQHLQKWEQSPSPSICSLL